MRFVLLLCLVGGASDVSRAETPVIPLSQTMFGLRDATALHRVELVTVDGSSLRVRVKQSWGSPAAPRPVGAESVFQLSAPSARRGQDRPARAAVFWASGESAGRAITGELAVVERGRDVFAVPWRASFERAWGALEAPQAYREKTSTTQLAADLATFDLFDLAFDALVAQQALTWPMVLTAHDALGGELVVPVVAQRLRGNPSVLAGLFEGAAVLPVKNRSALALLLRSIENEVPRPALVSALRAQAALVASAPGPEARQALTESRAFVERSTKQVTSKTINDPERVALAKLVRQHTEQLDEPIDARFATRVFDLIGDVYASVVVHSMLAAALGQRTLRAKELEHVRFSTQWLLANTPSLSPADLSPSGADNAVTVRPHMEKLFWAISRSTNDLATAHAALRTYARDRGPYRSLDDAYRALREAYAAADVVTLAAATEPQLFAAMMDAVDAPVEMKRRAANLKQRTSATVKGPASCFDWREDGEQATAICVKNVNFSAAASKSGAGWRIAQLPVEAWR